jgi:hypothetical protein
MTTKARALEMKLFGTGRDELPLIRGRSALNSMLAGTGRAGARVPTALPLGLIHSQARKKKLQEPLQASFSAFLARL